MSFPSLIQTHVLIFHPYVCTGVVHAVDQDEVQMCKNDVWQGIRVSTAAGKTLVIDPLIICPSSYVAQHILPAQFNICCPVVVWCVIYHLSVASIPLTCYWSLTHPGRKRLTKGQRVRESGIDVNVEINFGGRASGSAFISSIKAKDIDYV